MELFYLASRVEGVMREHLSKGYLLSGLLGLALDTGKLGFILKACTLLL